MTLPRLTIEDYRAYRLANHRYGLDGEVRAAWLAEQAPVSEAKVYDPEVLRMMRERRDAMMEKLSNG